MFRTCFRQVSNPFFAFKDTSTILQINFRHVPVNDSAISFCNDRTHPNVKTGNDTFIAHRLENYDMAKIPISEAVGMTGVSESTIRRDIRSGKLSSEKDEKGRRRIDTAELDRVYGITAPPERQVAEHDSQKVIAILENQVADLQKQLELSNDRETALIDEKSKLLDLLSVEKEEKRALMPPVDDKPKSRNWCLRNPFGAR